MAKKRVGINQTGRPQHLATVANKNRVIELVRCGVDQDSIAEELGIAANTLRKHYQFELKTARTLDTVEIVTNVIAQAKKGDKDMIKLYLEKLGGREWSQKASQLEISGPDGGPIAVQRFDFDAIPIEQARYLEQILDAVVVKDDGNGE